jgi:hypothetical protein
MYFVNDENCSHLDDFLSRFGVDRLIKVAQLDLVVVRVQVVGTAEWDSGKTSAFHTYTQCPALITHSLEINEPPHSRLNAFGPAAAYSAAQK